MNAIEFIFIALIGCVITWRFIVSHRPKRRTQQERAHSQREHFELKGSGRFDVGIVGESHYQDALHDIDMSLTRRNRECVAELYCEDTNAYDPDAVAVLIQGRKVGYLSRNLAPVYRGIIANSGMGEATGTCRARLFGGTKSKPSIGVWIDI